MVQISYIILIKRWIKNGLVSYGNLYLDKGAVESIVLQKKSLFAAGIQKVEGSFSAQQCVTLLVSTTCENNAHKDIVIGRGLVNYNCSEIKLLLGTSSKDIVGKLGYYLDFKL